MICYMIFIRSQIVNMTNVNVRLCSCASVFYCTNCASMRETKRGVRARARLQNGRTISTLSRRPCNISFCFNLFCSASGLFFFISLARTLPTRTDVMSRAQSRRFFSSMPRSRAKKRNSRKLNLSHVNARESNSTLSKLHKQ